MTTTARLLALLSLTLALGACAVRQAGAADGGQAPVQAGGGAAAAPAVSAPAAPSAAVPSAVPSSSASPTAAQPRSATPAAPAPAAHTRGTGAGERPAAAAASPSAAAQPAAPLTSTPVQETPAAQTAPGASAPAAPVAVPGTVPPPAAGPVTMPAASPTGSLLQTLFALVAVLAVLAGLAWFLKRYGPKGGIGGANLRIVGSLSLGGRERLLVVEVGNQWIVVGASPGRVNALATMPKQDGTDGAAPAATLAAHGPAANSFADWLKQTIDKRK